MRIKKNLNVYYDGLELETVNELWSRMLDLKTNIDGLDYVYDEAPERFEKTELWMDAKFLGESGVRYQAKKIDALMRKNNKETIFGTENMEFTEEDFRRIIARYRYLMSDAE